MPRSPKSLIYIWAFFATLSVLLSIWLAAKEGSIVAAFQWLWAFTIYFGSMLLVYSIGAMVSMGLFPDAPNDNSMDHYKAKAVHVGVMVMTGLVWMKLPYVSPFPFAQSENSRVRAISAFEAPEWGLKKKQQP